MPRRRRPRTAQLSLALLLITGGIVVYGFQVSPYTLHSGGVYRILRVAIAPWLWGAAWAVLLAFLGQLLLLGRAFSTSSGGKMSVRAVPAGELFISEPSPSMFGNDRNSKDDPNWTNANWLKSRFHFAFAEYSSRTNANFGVLRVMNDDLVQPDRGFGTHPHSNMEIVTYIVEGSLTHKDSMGTSETLGRGSVQYMTAGTGIRHSEYNKDLKSPLRFIQMWLVPRQRGLTPAYGSLAGTEPARNRWTNLVGDADASTEEVDTPPIAINTDANISVATVDADAADGGLLIELAEGRQAYLLVIEGKLSLNPSESCAVVESGGGVPGVTALERHDSAELRGPLSLRVAAGAEEKGVAGAHVLLVEMADDGSSRY